MKKSLKMPLLLWSVAVLFFAFKFILQMSVGILREDIMQKFSLDTVMFGSLAGYYYLGYAGMQIPIGVLLDKFNFRYVSAAAVMIAVLGTLTFVFAETIESLMIGRFLIGVGSAASFLAAVKIIKTYFPTRLHSLMIGFSFSFGLLGAVFGSAPMKLIFNSFGYNITFITLAVIGGVIAILILIISDKNTEKYEEVSEEETLSFVGLMKLIFHPTILFIGICGGLMVGSLEGFADVWAMPFFSQIYGFSDYQSTFIASVVFIGMCFGGPILAYLSEMIGSMHLMVFLTGVIVAIIFAILFYCSSLSALSSMSLMFVLGILCCYQVLVFSIAGSMVPISQAGVAIAIINCINMSFGHFFHTMISSLMQNGWDGALSTKLAPIYSHTNYIDALSVIPILCVIGSLGFLYLARKKR
jgi:predicted MFS family arabinose efflux permease